MRDDSLGVSTTSDIPMNATDLVAKIHQPLVAEAENSSTDHLAGRAHPNDCSIRRAEISSHRAAFALKHSSSAQITSGH
jgi:hypothetical protein